MPIEEIVDELVEEMDYDLSSAAEDLREIIQALKAGDEEKALKLAEDALSLLEPQTTLDQMPMEKIKVKKPKKKTTRGRKAKPKTKRK